MYRINEGSIDLPRDWQDRTINVVSSNPAGPGVSLTITRDDMPWGMAFVEYVEDQAKQAAQALKDFRIDARRELAISGAPAIEIECRWTAKQGAIDDLTIRVSTYRQYDDVRNQAVSYRNQAALYDMEAKNSRTAGILGAFGSMASSFGSAYSNYSKMNPKVSSSPITKTAAYNGGKTMYSVYENPR